MAVARMRIVESEVWYKSNAVANGKFAIQAILVTCWQKSLIFGLPDEAISFHWEKSIF